MLTVLLTALRARGLMFMFRSFVYLRKQEIAIERKIQRKKEQKLRAKRQRQRERKMKKQKEEKEKREKALADKEMFKRGSSDDSLEDEEAREARRLKKL